MGFPTSTSSLGSMGHATGTEINWRYLPYITAYFSGNIPAKYGLKYGIVI